MRRWRSPSTVCRCKVCGEADISRFGRWHASLCRTCQNARRRAQRRKPVAVRPALGFPSCKRCDLMPDPGYLVHGLCPACQRERVA